jgi:peroxiredoxin
MTATAPIARVGDRLPNLTLPLLGGENLALGDLRGKRLLLFFWGSW